MIIRKLLLTLMGTLKPINYVTYISWSIWSSQRLQKLESDLEKFRIRKLPDYIVYLNDGSIIPNIWQVLPLMILPD